MQSVTAAGGGGRAKSPKSRTYETFMNHAAALPLEDQPRANHAAEKVRQTSQQAKKAKEAWKNEFYSIANALGLSKEETKRRYLLIQGLGGINLNDLDQQRKYGLPNHVRFRDELEHRKNMLRLARGEGQNKLHVGKSDKHMHDPNADKQLDFILRPEDGGTLANLTQQQLQNRVCESNSAPLLDPQVILDYISGDKIQRRFYWVKAEDADKEAEKFANGERTRRQSKDPGYCSASLQDKDRNTSEWGHYVWKTRQFIPWVPIDREKLEPFLPALQLHELYMDLQKVAKITSDEAGRATKTDTKSKKSKDAQFIQSQKRGGNNTVRIPGKTQRVSRAVEDAHSKIEDAQSRAVFEHVHNKRVLEFEISWDQFAAHLNNGLGSNVFMNKMFEIVRILLNSNALVFSDRNGHKYDPTNFLTYRSLDDHLSYADERLRSLKEEYGLTDLDGEIDLHTDKKVFHTKDMQDAGIPAYELPPYAFYFDTKHKVLKLAQGGSQNLLKHHRHLWLPIARILDLLNKQAAFSHEEALERSKNPDDPVYGNVPLHPLIGPFCDVSLLQEEVLCKRASFDDLEDDSFPFPFSVFLDVSFPAQDARLVSNGHHNGHYVKYGASNWKRALLTSNGTEVEIKHASEEQTDEAGESSEDEYPAAEVTVEEAQEPDETQQ